MRLLLINSEFPPVGGGAGNSTSHIAQQLAKLGHDVTVVTSRFQQLPRKEQNERLTVYRIPSPRRKQDRSTAAEQIFFILSASLWTLTRIPRLKPDATLAFFGVPSGAVAWMLKIVFGIPYIVSLRGGDVPGFRPYDFHSYHRVVAPFLHVIWKQASAVVANSNGLRDLARAFDSRIDVPVIPNGVDQDAYFTQERDWSRPHILSVGRIVYQKGLDLAIQALSGLKDLSWDWYIVGDGPEMNALKSLVAQCGMSDHVSFQGWQSREELIQCYKQSNVFLFPSRHEGMPNAVLEAMASGLPVIASQIAGSEELVMDGATGFLVESENIEKLRDALKNLLTDSSLRQRMGAASRLRVEKFYSWENTAKQYALLLEKVK